MATRILTPANVARYLDWKRQHDHVEPLIKSWHDGFKEEVLEHGTWSQDGYTVAIREYQRQHFPHKLLLAAYPDIHEQFLTMLMIQALIVSGPPRPEQETPPPIPLMYETKPQSRKGKGD